MRDNLSRDFFQGMLDSLPFHIAVLDKTGKICFVNEGWRSFAKENGLESDERGINYLDVTRRTAEKDGVAREVLTYLEQACRGENVRARVEYSCNSPTGKRYFLVHISSFRYEGKPWIVVAHENVTAEVLNREREREMYSRFQQLFTHMMEGMVLHEWIRDTDGEIVDSRIIAANDAFAVHTALDVARSVGMSATQLYGMNPPPYFDVYKRVFKTGRAEMFETYYLPMDRYFWISAIPWGDGFATIFFDISFMKRKEKELEEMVKQKHFLFRELQHRTKNTFSLIAGLIGMIASQNTNSVHEALQKTCQQVVALAKVYDQLYLTDGGVVLDLDEYLESVLDGFVEGFREIFRDVKRDVRMSKVKLSAKRANLIGLWFVEVLTNAVKYAFGTSREGWLRIELCEEGDEVRIVYADGGRKEGEKSALEERVESSGFGSRIMAIVVEDLKGRQEVSFDDGIQIVLRFPHASEDREDI